MGSFKGDNRKPGRDRRRPLGALSGNDRGPEGLEERTLLSALVTTPKSVTDAALQGPVFAKGGKHLSELFEASRVGGQAFERTLAAQSQYVMFRDGRVGVDIYADDAVEFDKLSRTLKQLDLQVIASDVRNGVIEGFLPIDRLRDVSTVAGVRSMAPIFLPKLRTQGIASNQANEVMAADVARAQFNVDGSGVTVGVLSDSVDRFAGGLADSIATGDLPDRSRINVLLDEPAGGNNSDEGRAMMELIYDIAPGADLAFWSAFAGGPAEFGDGIRALSRQAGAQVIVDDVGFANEPIFQPGLIARAVTDVTQDDGATYFSAAGNSADQGIETNFRGVNGSVTGVGNGRFLDFDPGPGVDTTLEVTVNAAGTVVMWWDDPWFTGEADTNLDFFLVDANGAVAASGVNQNIGSASPQEFELVPAAGTYQLAIRVTGGPDPGRVRFQTFGADITVDQGFGTADTTFYPTTFGQPTSADAIGVGAVFFNDAPPFANPATIPTQDFSSAGPLLNFFDVDGNRLSAPQLLLKPDLSGPNGTNTSFFPPGGDIPQDPDDNPNFFGTSAAAPNVAAVAALMKQLNPSAGPMEIKDSLISTATPLNGTVQGEWDNVGGFGLVNAVRALASVDQLRIVASSPADAATVGSAPSFVELQLSKPVDPATLDASDLTFPVVPAGVTVTVGAPTLLDPMTVRFPVQFETQADGTEVNGTFIFEVANGAFTATDGSQLIGLTRAFIVSDVAAPRVTNTIFLGRIIVVEFNEAMRGSTITRDNLMLVRSGGTAEFGRPENVVVTDDPRAVLFYDAPNNRAIYDLRNLPQSALPSDVYAFVVNDEVRDAAGVRLDGNFSGQFPSGDGQPGGNFAQFLGGRFAAAPQIAGFGLASGSDTGIPGDRNTSQTRPTFSGFAVAQFPSTNAGLQVAIQFIQEHPADFNLDVGPGGRGFVGEPDLIVTTDDSGFFSFEPPFDLRDGFHRVRIVVVGEADMPPLPGNSTRSELSFRVDSTSPLVTASSVQPGTRLSNLRNVTLNFADPVSPTDVNNVLAVPEALDFPALDPETATNLGNYRLINLGPNQVFDNGQGDDQDLSRFIEDAEFVSTSLRTQPSDPYTARVELSFSDGLPSGRYRLVVTSGILDAAGNPLDDRPSEAGNQPFSVDFLLQPEGAFITDFTAFSPSAFNPGSMATSGPRDFYETPTPGFSPRAEAPPEYFHIDFSNTLAPRNYSNAVQLLRSANAVDADPDGDFGLGVGGFTRVDGITVELTNSVPGATIGQPGYLNRLVVRVPSGQVLPADYYRLVIPNEGSETISDVFGNVADLEFLGNHTPQGDEFEVFMPDGTYRDGLTGDGVDGGTFVTGFVVTPPQRNVVETGPDGRPQTRVMGNIIYARPDYEDDPFLSGDDPDGSRAKPFPTLLAEATANLTNGGNPNSFRNFGTGFNSRLDRNANGVFDRSAFVEAELAAAEGPVVIVALAAPRRPVPGTTETTQETFVIAPPSGSDPTRPENNASGSVPEQTMLVFDAGSTLKLFNASLFVQNQGSALQLRGGSDPSQQVVFTSLLDDSFGGDTNQDAADTTAGGGNWGGIVFRNFDDVSNGRNTLPGRFPVDGKLGLSGASDVLSYLDKSIVRFAGGAVPQTIGERFDSITLFNSRPAITNTTVADSAAGGGAGGTQAAISADLDSLREDEIARGPLVRRAEFRNNSINGLLLRPQIGDFQVRETNAVAYTPNDPTDGGGKNFVIDDPVPYVLASQLALGQRRLFQTPNTPAPGDDIAEGDVLPSVSSRLYVQPGMMVKFRPGANIALLAGESTINIGDRTYIRQFDANPNLSPEDPSFEPNTVGDAKPLFTSLFDDAAETFFFDQTTGVRRTIVPAGPTDNQGSNAAPQPGNVPFALRWGNLSVIPGARAVIDEAEFRYGGGNIATPTGTLESRSVIDLSDDSAQFTTDFATAAASGSFVSVTNNDFFDNHDAPVVVEPNQLLAADPLRPLLSGNPFFRGNLMQRNDINGLAINTSLGVQVTGPTTEFIPAGDDPGVNLTVNSVWDDTDIVHVLRGSIIMAGYYDFAVGTTFGEPLPNFNAFDVEEQPAITLTIASATPGKLLANGDEIARPGESAFVKLLNENTPALLGPGDAVDPALATPGGADPIDVNVGAGFLVGYDDGVDPPASPLIPAGVGSQLRFIGVGANESTGQQRVPVVVTSLRDATAGPVIRGIDQSNTFNNDVQGRFTGAALSQPAAGDGGLIAFGSTMLTDTNLFDPRNGSLIDNTDLRFLTRIDIQGGNIVDAIDFDANATIDLLDDWRDQKLGVDDPANQFNSANSMAISNSNLATFRDAGVFVYPGSNGFARIVDPVTGTASFPIRTGLRGQPVNLYMVNNTIANMPVGVRVNGETTAGPGDGDQGQNPFTVTLLHNTFYNNGVGFRTETPTFNGNNSFSHVYYIGMNNIFDGGTIGSDPAAAAVRAVGQNWSSELTFNVFNNYTTLYDDQTNTVNLGNKNVIQGSPNFFDPDNGNFFPLSGSVAIDAALSELGPVVMGDALFPIVNDPNLSADGGVRNTLGRNNPAGGLGSANDPRKIITLPGTPGRPFVDQFITVDARTPGARQGPATNLATPFYLPLGGERDLAGFQRIDDPTTANLGFGSRPFFDIGAREFRVFDPPQVTTEGGPDIDGDGVGEAVFASVINPTTNQPELINLYTPGTVQGTNRTPEVISFQFDEQIDPQTVSSLTVLLQASGGDGIFDNANSPADRAIPLSGRLAFDSATRRLTVRLASSGNLQLSNDLYRIVLVGQGGNVIRDPQGNALDGENLDAGGLPRALPSGDGFPGGNFVLPFTIDSRAPEIIAGTLRLAPQPDPSLAITNANPPSFTGTVNDLFPPVNPLVGQQVTLDLDIDGDGTFELLGVGTATTDATGNFTVTASQPITTDTPFNVGPDGQLGTADDSGYSRARVRVTDVSGNASDPDDPNAALDFILDTRGPRIVDATPASGSLVDSGRFRVSFTADENLSLASLMAGGAITVAGAGLDGVFGTMDDVAAGIDMASLNVEFLATSPSGPSRVSFDVTGASTSDVYRITVTDSVTDRAGNMLDGESSGGFPTGDGQPGGSFTLDVVVYTPGSERVIFVSTQPSLGTPDGSRSAPYRTIAEGLAVAGVGDTVAVLPGTYNEAVTLKSLVRLVSADPSSTDTQVVPGSARQTIIRAPLVADAPEVTVQGTGLLGLGGDLDTEFRGFSVVAPLSNLTSGMVQEDSTGLRLVNSGGLFHKNIVINAGEGISIVPNGGDASNARIESNLISGNRTGVVITDAANTSGLTRLVRIANNTFALNNGGMVVFDESANSGNLAIADVVNNIFWQNTSREVGSSDTAIAVFPPVAVVRSNMFSSNPNNPLLGFDPSALGTTPNAAAAFNFIGEPAFVSARDARPQFDGPTLFLLDGNFDLSANSQAIDAADQNAAPTTDLLNRGRVDIANRGFPTTGPSDVGAYEFQGTGGLPGGGVFIPGAGRSASATPVDSIFGSSSDANVTFEAGANGGVGQASQTAGQARRNREALRNLLSGRDARADEVAPQGRRPWQDLISRNRPRRG